MSILNAFKSCWPMKCWQPHLGCVKTRLSVIEKYYSINIPYQRYRSVLTQLVHGSLWAQPSALHVQVAILGRWSLRGVLSVR